MTIKFNIAKSNKIVYTTKYIACFNNHYPDLVEVDAEKRFYSRQMYRLLKTALYILNVANPNAGIKELTKTQYITQYKPSNESCITIMHNDSIIRITIVSDTEISIKINETNPISCDISGYCAMENGIKVSISSIICLESAIDAVIEFSKIVLLDQFGTVNGFNDMYGMPGIITGMKKYIEKEYNVDIDYLISNYGTKFLASFDYIINGLIANANLITFTNLYNRDADINNTDPMDDRFYNYEYIDYIRNMKCIIRQISGKVFSPIVINADPYNK